MPRSPNISEEEVAEAIRILRLQPKILAAYLHGSAVKQGLRPSSDVDIALLLHPAARLAPEPRLELAADLELAFRRTVDLGVIAGANLVYAAQVAAYGRRLFTRDPAASDDMMARFLADYADLQTARRPVLQRYAA